VFTNGCFDIVHRGHVELLKYCREIGSRVIVGLNSDDSVKKLKGDQRPYFNQQDRKILLENLSCVDEVHIFNEETPYDLISKLKPDIIVKGGDYMPSKVVGSDICEVRIFNFINGYSTTNILDKMK
jgi:D-beta-D-heptose 7-phosphate kinase/D-beta-D-heptose 1-phosphate adenosyltransferase|tara:strand:- start:403 stop:780 length:378 start_codon:yes stop_codon:yes gene_type:complete